MTELINAIREAAEGSLDKVSDSIIIAMFFVGAFIVIASIFALIIAIFLGISYAKYNRKKNSIGKTGEQVARTILDNNGLQRIKVSKTGSIMFGNSYSHFFKKIRLRRLTWKRTA